MRLTHILPLVIASTAWTIAAPADARPFTTRDAIEMRSFAEPLVSQTGLDDTQILYSPDRRHFLIVTKQGDVDANVQQYQLLVYATDSIAAALDKGAAKGPAPTVVATFRSNSNRAGIWRPRWRDDRTIAFLAENPGEVSQAYVVDLDGTKLRKLTDHPTPVMDFDTNASGGVIYAAIAPNGWTERERAGFAVGVDMLWNLQQRMTGGSFYPRLAFFAKTGSAPARPVAMEPFEVRGGGAWGMALSPDGRHAVSLIHLKDSPDNWWTDYQPVAQNRYFAVAGARSEFSAFTSEHREVFLQYVVIDMATGRMKPAVDAPSGLYFGGIDVGAEWVDARHVVLANTFLPLQGATGKEAEQRRVHPAAVMLDMADGSVARIADLPVTGMGNGGAMSGELAESALAGPNLLRLRFQQRGAAANDRYFRYADGRWGETQAPARAEIPFTLSAPQDLNTPPDLRATARTGGRSVMLTQLNPQWPSFDRAEAEVIEWKATDGRSVRGGLIKPAGYKPGRRYPLVIQTHGFDPDKFLVTGPGGAPSGYAARALAAQGIAVLQTADVTRKGYREELDGQMAVYKGAIDKLVADGIVDRDRVGMHGWSRTGLYVQHAIVFSDLGLKAASVADPGTLGINYHTMSFGAGYPGMLEQERLMGADLWSDEGRRLWAERDPVMNLDRVKAAIRIEPYGRTLGGWWDVYALLRRHNRPAEYVYYPEGQHVLARPREQMNSQGGNVDWYRFWLKGEVDPDPAKADQYRRWTAMRDVASRPAPTESGRAQ